MKSRIVLFFISLLVWLMLSWSVDWQHLLVGFFVSLLVAFLTGDLFTANPHKFAHPKRYLWFLNYIPVLLWEMVKANIDLAFRILHPHLPIRPGIVKVKTKLKSETGLTFLANSITLKPGTTSVDVDHENGYIYVHCINVKDTDTVRATEIIIKRLENILEKIFD
ncbi:MAG: Na+/H+ antiporter subunit E [Elusimicrobiota bacterium]